MVCLNIIQHLISNTTSQNILVAYWEKKIFFFFILCCQLSAQFQEIFTSWHLMGASLLFKHPASISWQKVVSLTNLLWLYKMLLVDRWADESKHADGLKNKSPFWEIHLLLTEIHLCLQKAVLSDEWISECWQLWFQYRSSILKTQAWHALWI